MQNKFKGFYINRKIRKNHTKKTQNGENKWLTNNFEIFTHLISSIYFLIF